MTEKPKRLGRGLEALIAGRTTPEKEAPPASALRDIPISEIRANPYQPRKEFRPEELADLESSMRASGLLQPITVRPAATGGGYELIAGERRLRSATRLGWTKVPAVVKEIDDRTLLTLALVENLQRADLNPIEEAEGYQRLIEEFGLTQQQVADVIGKDRTTVTNLLRVLNLPATVRRLVQDGKLSVGHARALLAVGSEPAMLDLAQAASDQGLSVREVERRARDGGAPRRLQREPSAGGNSTTAIDRPAEARRIEDQLWRRLQTDVKLSLSGADKGEIRIAFYSNDDLARLLDLMLGADRETADND